MYVKYDDKGVVKYPYSVDDLRKDNPNVSFPAVIDDETLEAFSLAAVLNTEKPDPDYRYAVDEIAPELTPDGVWIQRWVVRELTDEELEAATAIESDKVRSKRDQLLSESDWTMTVDSPLSDDQKVEWRNYRQDLRNVSQQIAFPWNVSWPTAPMYTASTIVTPDSEYA